MLIFDNMDFAIVGFLPEFASPDDPRRLQEQVNEAYAHGGGWNSFDGFELRCHMASGRFSLVYPGDPPMQERARARFRNQIIVLFDMSWVGIIENMKLIDVARID